MKRLKSTLAFGLMIAAGLGALGLGTVLAVAALVIGLVIAGAARLAMSAQVPLPQAREAASAEAQSTI